MEEIWKDIKGYEGYQVSNLGRVRTHNKITYSTRHGMRKWKDRILKFKGITPKTGYKVDLWKNKKPHTLLVARLIATTFLEDLIHTNMTVNHKDGNRLNNNITNLEWLSLADNIRYGFEHYQYKQTKTILHNKNNTFVFRSLSQANRFLGKCQGYINECIKFKRIIKDRNNVIYDVEIAS